jgi:hypothetical protein
MRGIAFQIVTEKIPYNGRKNQVLSYDERGTTQMPFAKEVGDFVSVFKPYRVLKTTAQLSAAAGYRRKIVG